MRHTAFKELKRNDTSWRHEKKANDLSLYNEENLERLNAFPRAHSWQVMESAF